ncbi:MAG: carbohydrate binding family 9 domain-containing protein, partial [Gemmatimonadetes bacterium]|nr:carbohydrate binding family 9 domain-containing protein [Gemmatimonadota bacterium]
MKRRLLALVPAPAALLLAVLPARAQTAPEPQARVTLLEGAAPAVDGRLDEAVWRQAEWTRDFTTREPVEGARPAGATEVAFLVDGGSLYVGARMHGAAPGDVRAQLARRDREGDAEQIAVSLDTYHDRRTAYTFAVSAAGTRIDYYHPTDNERVRSYSFDPVWQAEVRVDSAGWTAEMRIPLSQLRFSPGDQLWGVNMVRTVPARNEVSYWRLVKRNETGWASRMGQLAGLGRLRPSRRMELLPYVAAEGRLAEPRDPRDPFVAEREAGMRVGGDFKMGLGPSFTLEATVNPDFGQVEADPAEVNLTQFETFFSERRPFFVEGTSLLGSRGLFYSRRIGAPPPGTPRAHYYDRIDNTTILGAAKVTGRTRGGLSVATLAAVTAREHAATFDTVTDTFGRWEVAPPAGYGVVAVQQEFGRDRSTFGASITGVRRGLDEGSPLASLLPEQAVSGIVDGRLRWAGGQYDISGWLGYSHVSGDSLAILRLQRSPRRYYQRPDAGHVELDPSRTSLGGAVIALGISRNSGRHWLWDIDYLEQRPGLELNDVGQLGSADNRALTSNLRYRENQPGRMFRSYEVGVAQENVWNLDGVRNRLLYGLRGGARFLNFWGLDAALLRVERALSDDLTRGGPLMGTPAGWVGRAQLAGSPANRTRWQVSSYLQRDELGGWARELGGNLSFRPGPRWEMSIDPLWLRAVNPRQYVLDRDGGTAATFGRRYVFGFVERNEVRARLR